MNKRIGRHFPNQDKANDFYLTLVSQYDSVKLVICPLFCESGTYIWEVE